jgi:hypothetical protein
LLPIAYFGESFHHVGPVFWNTGEAGAIDNSGLFPLAYFGSSRNYVGPCYWHTDELGEFESGGLFPLMRFGEGLSYAGPIWWHNERNEQGESELGSIGLFPLAHVHEDGGYAANVIWSKRQDGSLSGLHAIPLFSYKSGPLGGSRLLTPLGGHGVTATGDTTFLNLLGPVYHYRKSLTGYSVAALWPLFSMTEEPMQSRWDLWPLIGHSVARNADGETVASETTALAGIFHHSGIHDTQRLALPPLFSYRGPAGEDQDLSDQVSLVAYKESENGAHLHVGTPLLFDYESDVDSCSWHALLGAVDYESDAEGSEFNLLYYMYRQKTVGEETRVNAFPFVNYDKDGDSSQFSILWRLFNYERDGDKVGGHILFIPWSA